MSIRRHFLRERRRLVKRRTNIDLIRLFATFLLLHGFEIEVPHGLFRHVEAIDQYLAVTIGSEPSLFPPPAVLGTSAFGASHI